ERERRRQQGAARRSRRRHRLRDRRRERRRQGRLGRDPRRAERRRHLPDRGAVGRQEPDGRRTVRGVRDVARRPGDPARGRLPDPVPARPPTAPRALLLVAAAAALFFALPLLGLLLGAPWSGLSAQICSRPVLDALWLSLQCSVAAAVLSLLLGLPLAVWLAD